MFGSGQKPGSLRESSVFYNPGTSVAALCDVTEGCFPEVTHIRANRRSKELRFVLSGGWTVRTDTLLPCWPPKVSKFPSDSRAQFPSDNHSSVCQSLRRSNWRGTAAVAAELILFHCLHDVYMTGLMARSYFTIPDGIIQPAGEMLLLLP